MPVDRCEGRPSQIRVTFCAGEVLVQVFQEADQRLGVVGVLLDLEHQRGLAAVRPVGQRAGHRQPGPVEPVAQHRGLAAGRPGGPHRRAAGRTRFRLGRRSRRRGAGRFFIRGQSCFTQVAIASSLRSTRAARRALPAPAQPLPQDRPGLGLRVPDPGDPLDHLGHPGQRPHLGARTRSPAAPPASAASTSASCSSVSLRRRPARPAPASPSRPCSCQARYHRDAVCADTPSAVTTSTCRLPRANMSAACSTAGLQPLKITARPDPPRRARLRVPHRYAGRLLAHHHCPT